MAIKRRAVFDYKGKVIELMGEVSAIKDIINHLQGDIREVDGKIAGFGEIAEINARHEVEKHNIEYKHERRKTEDEIREGELKIEVTDSKIAKKTLKWTEGATWLAIVFGIIGSIAALYTILHDFFKLI